MLGTIANTGAILTGCVVGSTLKKGIGEKYKTVMMDSMGLAATALGINSIAEAMPESQYHVLFIVSLALGGLIWRLSLTGLWEGFPAALSCLRDCLQRSCCSVQARFRFWDPCRAPFWEIIPSFIPMLFWTELLLRYSALPLASVSPLRQRCFFAGRGVSICWQV